MISIPNLAGAEFIETHIRYEADVDRSHFVGCHPWIGGTRDTQGYGKFPLYGRKYMAHRIGWYFAHGEDPGSLLVRHTCDNPPCQNPDHWLLGTQQDNVDDRQRRGRAADHHGDANGRSLLTAKQVEEMRVVWMLGFVSTLQTLGELYRVSKSQASKIINGDAWGHLWVPKLQPYGDQESP